MSVLDSSAVIDYLLGDGVAEQVQSMLTADGPVAAPDLLVFEVLAVLRRLVARGEVGDARARGAVEDLGALRIDLFPTLPLSRRAFALRTNVTAADALFVALAEALGESLATKDGPLAAAVREHTHVEVILLDPPASS